MTAGRILVVVGLGLNCLATLFLSLDALRNQGESSKLSLIEGFAESASNVKNEFQTTDPAEARSAHDKQILDAINILLEAAPVAAKNNEEIKHKERMKQIERFYRWVPFVKSTITLVAAGFLIEIVGVVFFNG
jgi:hypothetical protein